ncbi:putative integral membrane protein (apicoplast) [Babesia bovis T2Bo]|uniref:Rp16 n=1 Tax=Babesia bovis TaxID=5865 RepID=A7AXG4_BABBO|nr:putative integral membrane protein [Babesia bovis T2Bo]EDO05087.1 putative integral membrane protein [Babesia bovis T2Bo]|eukprot:YP_002290867.1 rp16 (apicoplast) [Babesia bovis T2Bo]
MIIKYFKSYKNKHFNSVKFTYIIDKYTKNINMSFMCIKTKKNSNILALNNTIFKNFTVNPIFIYKNKYKFFMFVKSFVSKFYSAINSLFDLNVINIQILSIFYKVVIIHNKLIIKINNFINIIIYITDIEQVKVSIQYTTPTLVSISSYNKSFINSLSSVIVNCKKFNVYTNKGIKYLDQNIKLKKIIKLRKR